MDADLTSAMLDGAILYRAYLRDADLTRAHLDSADLTDAVLENADLSHADLKNANLTEAFFKNANLAHADLSDANLTRAFFGNANLTCADFGNSGLTRGHIDGVDFTGAQLGAGARAVPAGWAVGRAGKLEPDLQDQPLQGKDWWLTLPGTAGSGGQARSRSATDSSSDSNTQRSHERPSPPIYIRVSLNRVPLENTIRPVICGFSRVRPARAHSLMRPPRTDRTGDQRGPAPCGGAGLREVYARYIRGTPQVDGVTSLAARPRPGWPGR